MVVDLNIKVPTLWQKLNHPKQITSQSFLANILWDEIIFQCKPDLKIKTHIRKYFFYMLV